MNILFIEPTPGFGIIDEKQRKKRAAGFFPPLGIAILATILEQKGHKCKVIDLQIEQYTAKDFLKEIKSFNSEIICISIFTALATEAFKLSKLIKENLNLPIICGGPHVSLFPKETLEQNKEIDYIVFGEGEHTLPELINALEKNLPKENIKGIFFRKDEKIIETEKRSQIYNLDEIPIPSRKFFKMKKYIQVPNQYNRLPITNIITSRGCAYNKCKFCSESGELHSHYRRNSVERVIEEIKYLIDNYKIREIYFWDDEFVVDNNWVQRFCESLKKENFDLTWTCCAKVNYVNQKILKIMASAGCWNIFYGLESGDQKLLDDLKKGQTLEEIRNAIKWTKEAGIKARGSFILGLPGETPELGQKTINFAIELDLDYAIFCLTTPYPGTKLYKEFLDKGNKNIEWDKYTSFFPVYLPEGYKNKEELIELQKSAYKQFYFRYNYIKNIIKSLKNKQDLKRNINGVKYLLKMKLLNSPGL